MYNTCIWFVVGSKQSNVYKEVLVGYFCVLHIWKRNGLYDRFGGCYPEQIGNVVYREIKACM